MRPSAQSSGKGSSGRMSPSGTTGRIIGNASSARNSSPTVTPCSSYPQSSARVQFTRASMPDDSVGARRFSYRSASIRSSKASTAAGVRGRDDARGESYRASRCMSQGENRVGGVPSQLQHRRQHPRAAGGGQFGHLQPGIADGPVRPRGGEDLGKEFELRDRIDAAIAHEVAESIASGTHEGAEALAAETELPVSDGARRSVLMAGRGR